MLNETALITIIQNGNEFFKIWYKYYSSFIPEENIYVIDYGSTDGSLDGCNCNIISKKEFSIEKLHQGNAAINSLKSSLLHNYRSVIYADYDEIIFHPQGLEKLLTSGARYYTTFGYEIIQVRDKEAPLDFTRKILPQRSFWYRCPVYDKSLITSIDFDWALGNHSAVMQRPIIKNGKADGFENVVLPPNHFEDLCLIHLHKVDFNHCLKLNETNIKEKGEAKGGGLHNFITGERFEKWWQEAEAKATPIPPHIKKDLDI